MFTVLFYVIVDMLKEKFTIIESLVVFFIKSLRFRWFSLLNPRWLTVFFYFKYTGLTSSLILVKISFTTHR